MLQHCCLYLLPAAEVLQHICKKKHVQDNIEFYMFWWILSTESCQYLGSISGWCVNTVKQNTQLNCCRDGNNLISKATNLPSISNPGIQLVFADLIFCSFGVYIIVKLKSPSDLKRVDRGHAIHIKANVLVIQHSGLSIRSLNLTGSVLCCFRPFFVSGPY